MDELDMLFYFTVLLSVAGLLMMTNKELFEYGVLTIFTGIFSMLLTLAGKTLTIIISRISTATETEQ